MKAIWNKMPFFLKFSFVFTLTLTVLFLLGLALENLANVHSDMGTPTTWALIIFTLPICLLLGEDVLYRGDQSFVIPLSLIITYTLLIGSLFGFVIGKIRNIRKKQEAFNG